MRIDNTDRQALLPATKILSVHRVAEGHLTLGSIDLLKRGRKVKEGRDRGVYPPRGAGYVYITPPQTSTTFEISYPILSQLRKVNANQRRN